MWDTVFQTHYTTGAITGPYEKKSSTQNGSTLHLMAVKKASIMGGGCSGRKRDGKPKFAASSDGPCGWVKADV